MILRRILTIILCLASTAGIVFLFSMLKIDSGSSVTSSLNEEIQENSVYVYCIDNSYSSIKKYLYKSGDEAEKCTIDELIEKLKAEPEDLSSAPAINRRISVNDYFIGEDGQLIIDFSKEYLELMSSDEVLTRAAVVKTLCQLNPISYVEFRIDGQPLVLNEEIPVGMMNEKMFVDTSGSVSDYDQQINITVYYGDEKGKKLNSSQLIVESIGFKSAEEIVIEQLINGPINESISLKKTIPDNTVLNKVKTTEGLCFVDLSSEFLDDIPGISRNVKVYSIVNSLCELSNVKNVKISVNGQPLEGFRNYDYPDVMQAKPDMISTESNYTRSGNN